MAAKNKAKTARQRTSGGRMKAQETTRERGRGRKTKGAPAAAGYRRSKAGELTAMQRSELEAALAPDKPLAGVTVPSVDLRRGSTGGAVKQLQSALVKLRLMTQAQMNTGPGNFGPQTEASLKRFQKAQGVDAIGVYGPKTRAAFVKLGARLASAPRPVPTGALRTKLVAEGKWFYANRSRINYDQKRPLEGINHPHKLPLTTDCSGLVTLCYKWAGAPDPNSNGYNGWGNTSTLGAHMPHIPQSQIQPGDVCYWEAGPEHSHVSLVLEAGRDPLLVSHGVRGSGPRLIRLSAQKKSHAGARLIWLGLAGGKRTIAAFAQTSLTREEEERGDPPTEDGIPEEDYVPLPPDL